jgi:hypothetical protein
MPREICMVIDVETCNTMDDPLVYDIGFAIVERATGKILESHSLIIWETFCGMSDLMASAYYAEKIPAYRRGIARGDHRIVRLMTAWKIIRDAIRKYGIRRVYAYNMAFDRNALNTTLRYVTASRFRWFLPYGVETCCIWHMACRTILNSNKYRAFCEAHGFVSKFGNYRTSAETAYAFLSGIPHFTESHTGLEDVEIEVAIMSAVLRRKRRLYEKVFRSCWRVVQPPRKKVA